MYSKTIGIQQSNGKEAVWIITGAHDNNNYYIQIIAYSFKQSENHSNV